MSALLSDSERGYFRLLRWGAVHACAAFCWGVRKIALALPVDSMGWQNARRRGIPSVEMTVWRAGLRVRGMGVAICDPQVERNVRNDMPTGWSGVSLSDVPGRDSRAFKSSAYMVICVRDSTGSKQGVGMGQTGTNANGGRRCRQVQSVTAEKSAFRDASCCRGVRDPDAWSRMPWGIGRKLGRYGRRCGVGCRGPPFRFLYGGLKVR